MASNTHAPEDPYGPPDGAYGQYGRHLDPHPQDQHATYGDGFAPYGQYASQAAGYRTEPLPQMPQTPQVAQTATLPTVPTDDPGAVSLPGALGLDGGEGDEWNPTEDSVRGLRGRHRVAKQRAGGMARGGAVLGVGVIAAVGAGGMATAQGKDPSAISVPDVAGSAGSAVESAAASVQDVPVLGDVAAHVPGISAHDDASALDGAPLTRAGLSAKDVEEGRSDAGEALRNRILAQARQQQSGADSSAHEAAVDKAVGAAEGKAAEAADHARKTAAEHKRKADEAERRKEEAARRAKAARGYALPVGSYQLSAGFGQAGNMWQHDHTGQDFAAPTGTPVKAVHGGTVKEAGWAGSYGYRTVLETKDGTELWFCHQSSITKSVGDKVRTGEVIGRVGATGNVTGPHLHLEVRPGGSDPIDPMPWLRDKGLTP